MQENKIYELDEKTEGKDNRTVVVGCVEIMLGKTSMEPIFTFR